MPSYSRMGDKMTWLDSSGKLNGAEFSKCLLEKCLELIVVLACIL
jgi:hypothetical protein